MAGEVALTSELLWKATLVAAAIDAPLLAAVARFVPRTLFAELRWYLAAAAAGVYAGLWGVFASLAYWDAVYSQLFPAASRFLLPLGFGALYGALALAFWRVSLKARWPAAAFAALGGLVSLVGHGIGIARGLMRVPMLSQASAVSALAFGVFEFVFYWCAIVALAAAAWALERRLRGRAA